MAEERKPTGIKVPVPAEYGAIYGEGEARQYVERRQQMGRALIKELEELANLFTEEKQFEKACKILQWVFVDWNLKGETREGNPFDLPKPWQNPKAFTALLDLDLDLTLWVLGLVTTPISQLLLMQSDGDELKN